MQLHRTPKIKKALSRAIEHEIKSPGELASYMEYLHLQKAFRAAKWVRDKKLKKRDRITL